MTNRPEDEVDRPEDGSGDGDRRRHERFDVSQPIKLEAKLRGRFVDIMRIELTGESVNVGGGGILARVDQGLAGGVRCLVRFDGDDADESSGLWAHVRRSLPSEEEGFFVALEFDDPVSAAEALARFDVLEDQPIQLEVPVEA